jgi:hypothetical protein
MDAAMGELQRRLRGGLKTVASTEARVTSTRARDDMVQSARRNPVVSGAVGLAVVVALGFVGYRVVSDARERARPENRMRRSAQQARAELAERLSERVQRSRRQLEQHQRSLLLKLDPTDGGYLRVSDARLEPVASKNKERTEVLKKLVWAGLLSVFMALGSVLARRVAGRVWMATVREDPPTHGPR